jgi:O-methyltransferase
VTGDQSAPVLRRAFRFLGPLRPHVLEVTRRAGVPRYSWLLDRLNWELHLAGTLHAFPDALILPSREDLYEHVNLRCSRDGESQAIDYLEFGVAEGGTFAHWLELNTNEHSRFFGFDSFEGLPEDWNLRQGSGGFSTGGKPPQTSDPRAQFIVGWFQHTLADFLASYAPASQLVIHIDCDLYSSTLYCLTELDRLIVPGTVVMFDEFYDPLHEYRALVNYCAAYMREFDVIATTQGAVQAAVVFR